MNTAYKHLDSKLRIAELTIGQWIGLAAGVVVGVVWGVYLCPFGDFLTLFSSVYLGALPAGAALLASASEFDLALTARSAVKWWRRDARYVPGPGESQQGYVVRSDDNLEEAPRRPYSIDLATLWDD